MDKNNKIANITTENLQSKVEYMVSIEKEYSYSDSIMVAAAGCFVASSIWMVLQRLLRINDFRSIDDFRNSR